MLGILSQSGRIVVSATALAVALWVCWGVLRAVSPQVSHDVDGAFRGGAKEVEAVARNTLDAWDPHSCSQLPESCLKYEEAKSDQALDDLSQREAALLDLLDSSRRHVDELEARTSTLDAAADKVEKAVAAGAPGEMVNIGGQSFPNLNEARAAAESWRAGAGGARANVKQWEEVSRKTEGLLGQI